MVARKYISRAIDDAAVAFEYCLETLLLIKDCTIEDRERLVRFQYDLATALSTLDRVYLNLTGERRALVQRKPRLSPSYFRKRIGQVEKYRLAILETIKIGKSIGDAFAWIFYSSDTHFLAQHLKHPGSSHTPPGVGGVGELEFVKNFDAPRHVLIYHATTTFLRIGDVSFVHLPSRSVSAIVELKSRWITENRVEVAAFFVGLPTLAERMPLLTRLPPAEREIDLPPTKRDQLARQVERMADVVETRRSPVGFGVAQSNAIHLFNDMVGSLRFRQMSHVRVGRGLAVAALRISRRGTRLSRRILDHAMTDYRRWAKSAPAIAIELADRDSRDNSLIMFNLNVGYAPGMVPFLWLPVASECLRALIFKEVVPLILFNPLHLRREMETAGFEVATSKTGMPTVVTTTQTARRMIMTGVEKAVEFSISRFVAEEAIVRVLGQQLTFAETQNLGHGQAIAFNLEERLDLEGRTELPGSARLGA